jgi:hypothetical protein
MKWRQDNGTDHNWLKQFVKDLRATAGAEG